MPPLQFPTQCQQASILHAFIACGDGLHSSSESGLSSEVRKVANYPDCYQHYVSPFRMIYLSDSTGFFSGDYLMENWYSLLSLISSDPRPLCTSLQCHILILSKINCSPHFNSQRTISQSPPSQSRSPRVNLGPYRHPRYPHLPIHSALSIPSSPLLSYPRPQHPTSSPYPSLNRLFPSHLIPEITFNRAVKPQSNPNSNSNSIPVPQTIYKNYPIPAAPHPLQESNSPPI